MYSYGYICQVWGTSPNGFETGIHKKIRTGKGTFFSLREIKLIVKIQPQMTIQYDTEKNKCCAITKQGRTARYQDWSWL